MFALMEKAFHFSAYSVIKNQVIVSSRIRWLDVMIWMVEQFHRADQSLDLCVCTGINKVYTKHFPS